MKPLRQRRSEIRASVYTAIEGVEGIDPDERARRRMLIDELLEKHPEPTDALNAYMNECNDAASLNAQLTEVMQRGMRYGTRALRRCLDETMGPNEAYAAFCFAAGRTQRLIEDSMSDPDPTQSLPGLLLAIGEGMTTLGYASAGELADEEAMSERLQTAVHEAVLRAKAAKAAHAHPEGEHCQDCGKEHVKVPPGGILLIGIEPATVAMLAAGRVVRLPDSGKFLRTPIMLAQASDLGPQGIARVMDGMKPQDVTSVPWATGLLVSRADIGRRDVLDFISRPDVAIVEPTGERKDRPS